MEFLPRPGLPADPTVPSVGDGLLRVRFEGIPRPFRAIASTCDNPDCDCEDLTLDLTEELDEALQPLRFTVRLDLETGAMVEEDEERPPVLEALAEELVEAFPAASRDRVRQDLRRFRREHLSRLVLDPAWLDTGALVPLSHVLVGGPVLHRSLSAWYHRFERGSLIWLVSDSYCPQPRCDCMESALRFVATAAAEDGSRLIPQGPEFHARVALGKGRVTFQDGEQISRDEAIAVVSDWQRTSAGATARLRLRYDALKAAAKVAVERRRAAADQLRAVGPPPPVGRRQPCPCGSGERYKNCCGRAG